MKLVPYLISLVYILCVSAKTILLTNDDSWALTNIRATYKQLTDAGYDVILVAPVLQRSGWAGKFDLPSSTELESDGEFGYVKEGSPSWGHEDDDKNIWYFNGTPASCVVFALDYVIPKHFNNVSIDLTIGGPNEGPNLSPGFYTTSGTMGAVYSSIYRGIPAISFSGSNQTNSFYEDGLNDDDSNSANIYSKKVVDLVNEVLNSSSTLPNMVGINVNFPFVGSDSDSGCDDPEWVYTRMMGTGVLQPNMEYNDDTGLMEWTYTYIDDLQKDCEDGDCSLPSEYSVYLSGNCSTSVSVFTIDYGASLSQSNNVKKIIGDLF